MNYLITYRTFLNQLALIVLCGFLSSCFNMESANVKKKVVKKTRSVWLEQKKKRQSIKNWELRGRLGVQTEYNGMALDIIWKQSDQEYTMHLIAPLGASTYMINGDNEHAEIHYPDGQVKIIDNVDKVFREALSVELPISAIKDWVRGLPAQSMKIKKIRLNRRGLIHRLEQAGWHVELTKYSGSKLAMPHALYITHDNDEELDIRLLLRQWMIDN